MSQEELEVYFMRAVNLASIYGCKLHFIRNYVSYFDNNLAQDPMFETVRDNLMRSRAIVRYNGVYFTPENFAERQEELKKRSSSNPAKNAGGPSCSSTNSSEPSVSCNGVPICSLAQTTDSLVTAPQENITQGPSVYHPDPNLSAAPQILSVCSRVLNESTVPCSSSSNAGIPQQIRHIQMAEESFSNEGTNVRKDVFSSMENNSMKQLSKKRKMILSTPVKNDGVQPFSSTNSSEPSVSCNGVPICSLAQTTDSLATAPHENITQGPSVCHSDPKLSAASQIPSVCSPVVNESADPCSSSSNAAILQEIKPMYQAANHSSDLSDARENMVDCDIGDETEGITRGVVADLITDVNSDSACVSMDEPKEKLSSDTVSTGLSPPNNDETTSSQWLRNESLSVFQLSGYTWSQIIGLMAIHQTIGCVIKILGYYAVEYVLHFEP